MGGGTLYAVQGKRVRMAGKHSFMQPLSLSDSGSRRLRRPAAKELLEEMFGKVLMPSLVECTALATGKCLLRGGEDD